jgi:integrase
VYYIHSILDRALRDAVRWGYVVRNVADVADPPRAKTPEMRVWSPVQLRAFLDHVRGDRLYAAWLLAATTGMRREEILGLRWSDLDLDAGRVAVRRPRILVDYQVLVSEPKTAKGRRSLALDPVTVAALRAHRARLAEEKLAVGGRYRDSELVFTRPDGTAVHPERFSDWFRRRVRAAGLPRIRLHDVRHSYAPAALAAGVPAKVVSERLGHANIAITMDTYSHVLPGLDEQAAGQVARLILGDGDPVPGMLGEQTVSIRPAAADKPARRDRKGAGQRGVRAGGFEPPRVAPPGPKPGASAGSATLASCGRAYRSGEVATKRARI